MGKTSIEWADKVWNPTVGCTKVSAGLPELLCQDAAR